ncbi:TPA: hypothetical protein ACV5P9_004826 [Salmonella enterica subsp. enterica serovar Typhimurium]|nr:hypothetical protein [Escherichia coli]
MRPSIIFATAEYVKRLREECLRENKPLHRHTRFRRQELVRIFMKGDHSITSIEIG